MSIVCSITYDSVAFLAIERRARPLVCLSWVTALCSRGRPSTSSAAFANEHGEMPAVHGSAISPTGRGIEGFAPAGRRRCRRREDRTRPESRNSLVPGGRPGSRAGLSSQTGALGGATGAGRGRTEQTWSAQTGRGAAAVLVAVTRRRPRWCRRLWGRKTPSGQGCGPTGPPAARHSVTVTQQACPASSPTSGRGRGNPQAPARDRGDHREGRWR